MKVVNKIGPLLLTTIITFLLAQPMLGQVKMRLIPFPEWANANEAWADELSLELMEIRVAGKPVVLGEQFEADENWLQNMTLIVRNIGKKPIVAFGVGGGLLAGVDEELPTHASFQYGIAWNAGRRSKKRKPIGIVLKPGATIELTYANVDQLTRNVLARPGEGSFCKLKFMGPSIVYSDGTTDSPGGGGIKFHLKGRV